MKVLFALNNDNVSNAIIKKYQKQYKEIISYKNVYYFNAILKELQKDKTYDRVVISEDLEPFANNDYDTIDKFIFEKLDKISDEAAKQNGDDIEIILICSDRINKGDSVLVKFFGIGIYNAIIGNDRQIETVCSLINQPRTKKEAKLYYKIESNSVNYQSENENSVNETEVQNILAHYKRLGKNEDKYVDSFNTIVAQYTDEQLKVIIKCLPLHVRAVLEERSPKYQELATFTNDGKENLLSSQSKSKKNQTKKNAITAKMLDDDSAKTKITKPIVIPTSIKSNKLKEISEKQAKKTIENNEDNNTEQKSVVDENQPIDIEFVENTTEKRGRGRPRKNVVLDSKIDEQPKRGRGRPKKESLEEKNEDFEEDTIDLNEEMNIPDVEINGLDIQNIDIDETEEDSEPIDLFNIGDTEDVEQEMELPDEEEQDEAIDLFNLDDDEEDGDNKPDEDDLDEAEEEDDLEENEQDAMDLFNIETEENNDNHTQEISQNKTFNQSIKQEEPLMEQNKITETQNVNVFDESSTLITKDVKVVCFVGTTKNGTSFLVNNVAELLSEMNIPTAILDMTTSKNAYYIYTKNDERLRNIAIQSIKKLDQGIANGIKVNKDLSVYTSLPDEELIIENVDTVLSTLKSKHAVVLIDCDFNTNIEFFEKAEEIYLVQTQDVLTIQPFTAFLRNLKAKNVLKQEKLKIVLNKNQKVKGLNDKVLIGGMAYYNDPGMAFMTELFNKDKVMYCKIPFEMQNYSRYLASMVDCVISLNGYTKQFINALQELAGMVYPLINKPKYSPRGNKKAKKTEIFSSSVNDTLNKMKNNY